MNMEERFRKIDALDKNKKREILANNSTANNDMWDRLGKRYPQSSPDAWGPQDLGEEEVLEMVDHPNHYGGKENIYEAINVIEAWDLDFHCGSVIKYIARHKKKGQARQDIEKAIWYLQRYLDECIYV